MAGEIYNMIRDVGRSISGAITAGPEARLRSLMTQDSLEQTREARDLRRRAREEQESRSSARQRAADLMKEGKGGTDEFYGELINAGEDLSQVSRLRMDRNRPPKNSNTPQRYENRATLDNLAIQLNDRIGEINKRVANAKEGEDTTALKQQAIAEYDATQKLLQTLQDSQSTSDATYTVQLARLKDSVMAEKDEARIDLISTAVASGLRSYKGGRTRELLDLLEENKTKWSRYVDTSGVPSAADISNLKMAMNFEGETDQNSLKELLNVRDPEQLSEIIDDEDTPEPVAIMGLLILKNALAASGVGVTLSEEPTKSKKKFTPDKKERSKGPRYHGR